jgi:hypothetical protein
MQDTAKLQKLASFRQTIGEVFRMAGAYSSDLDRIPGGFKNIFEVYNYVRDLPYREDPKGLETVSRPVYTLSGEWQGPRDCDDKTLIILAAAKKFGIPGRAVVCGEVPAPHHVYPELQLSGKWIPFDATYSDAKHDCRLGERLYGEVFREELYG